jgi:hypothetical protein
MGFLERRRGRKTRQAIPVVRGTTASFSDWSRSHSLGDGLGIIYLLESASLDSYKIGFTRQSSDTDRIDQHLKFSWSVIQTWTVEDAELAESVEQTVLDWWRHTLSLPSSVAADQMPQGGHTETVNRNDIELADILEFVETQCARQPRRPSVEATTGTLVVGVRSVVSGQVTLARLDRRNSGQFEGQRRYRWIYRYIVTDTHGSIVVESHLNRKRQSQIAGQVRLPPVGSVVRIEGRPRLVFGEQYVFGFIDPLAVLDPGIDQSQVRLVGRCGSCKVGRYTWRRGSKSKSSKWASTSSGWICVECRHETRLINTDVSCGNCCRGLVIVKAVDRRNRSGYVHRFALGSCNYCSLQVDPRVLEISGG